LETGERVWRMRSPRIRQADRFAIADMKNTGTRNGGSIHRRPVPAAFSSTARRGRISTSREPRWRAENRHQSELGFRYGVRLLERLVAEIMKARNS